MHGLVQLFPTLTGGIYMARKLRADQISVQLIVDRKLWHMARYMNIILGPSFHTRGMQDWVQMLIGRYVKAQLDDPETFNLLQKEFNTARAHASHRSAHTIMKDVKTQFWKENIFASANPKEPTSPSE